jgi:hypothetical protein
MMVARGRAARGASERAGQTVSQLAQFSIPISTFSWRLAGLKGSLCALLYSAALGSRLSVGSLCRPLSRHGVARGGYAYKI